MSKLDAKARVSTLSRTPGTLFPVIESPTHDPVLNLQREAALAKTVQIPSFRVWRSSDSVVLGRFLEPNREVDLSLAAKLDIPVIHRTSGGGAVFHDLGNINYSIYLPEGLAPARSFEESLRLLSFPVTELLDTLGIAWSWEPPNNVFVRGAKISGSSQARSRGRLLHHGTLLVSADLDRMFQLLRPGGRSCIAPVMNLEEIVKSIRIDHIEKMINGILAGTAEQSA